ncbi:hypothetical protein KFK09_006840 [Dendrobium nobile]|uniref:Uncharacterized protein n=1 Tax=Dendrobium nobile TaxID=94219 RepID=A0A8T3BVI5_DENNO|nr:hypothetical protein KFK09_006840 [Dendrobium nobile]
MSALSSRHFWRDRIASVWSVVARVDDRNWTPMTEGGVRGRVRCRTELVAGLESGLNSGLGFELMSELRIDLKSSLKHGLKLTGGWIEF